MGVAVLIGFVTMAMHAAVVIDVVVAINVAVVGNL